MTPQIATVLIIIGLMSVSFFTEILPLAFTALLVPVALQATGILNATQAWSGFSNTTIITWIGLFIVGAMFAKTSVTYQIKRFVAKYGSQDASYAPTNCGLTLLALLYGEKDYTKTLL